MSHKHHNLLHGAKGGMSLTFMLATLYILGAIVFGLLDGLLGRDDG